MSAKEHGQRTFEAYEAEFIADSGPIAKALPWDEYANKDFWARVEAVVEAPHLAELASLRARVAELEADRLPLVERCVDAMMTGKLCAKHRAEWIELFERVGPKAISEILAHCDGCVREELEQTEAMRQAEIKERKRAEARVRHWETATGETNPRIVKAKLHERDALVAKLGEAIELAGEMMPYVDEYFRKKWGYEETQAALKAYHASLGQDLPPDLPAPGRDRDAPRAPTVDRMEAEPERAAHDHAHEPGSCSFCDRALRQGATPCLTWQEPEYGGRCRACGRYREDHEGRGQ